MCGEVAQVALTEFPHATFFRFTAPAVFRLDGKTFLTDIETGELLFLRIILRAVHTFMAGREIRGEPADEAVTIQRFGADAQTVQRTQKSTAVVEQLLRRSLSLFPPVYFALIAVHAEINLLRGNTPALVLGNA